MVFHHVRIKGNRAGESFLAVGAELHRFRMAFTPMISQAERKCSHKIAVPTGVPAVHVHGNGVLHEAREGRKCLLAQRTTWGLRRDKD